MLRWALVFLVLGIITAIFGFGIMSGPVAGLAEILCYGFFALAVITLVANFSDRRSA